MYHGAFIQYRMPRHCGMCTLPFNDGDRVNSLRPDPHLGEPACVVTIDLIYRLGSYDLLDQRDLFRNICSDASCPCPKDLEHAVIHKECMNLFFQHAYPRCSMFNLWQAAVWRHPWRNAQWLNLPFTITNSNCIAPMDWVGRNFDIPELRALPNELVTMIWDSLGPSEMWRYGHSLDFIGYISQPRSKEHHILLEFYLGDILSWRRGSLPILELCQQCEPKTTYTRLTFDARGLLRIDTMDHEPPFYAAHSEEQLYVLEKTTSLGHVRVNFQYGFARLHHPADEPIRFWNTPNPPSLKECAVDREDLPPRCRLRVIDLRQCDVISFFVGDDSTFAVHGHAPTSRLAMDSQTTYDQVDHQVQATTECLQVALTDDKMVGFGILVRRDEIPSSQFMIGPERCFVLSMEKQGIVILGTKPDGPHDIIWVSENPEWLVFDSPTDCPVRLVGCYPRLEATRQAVDEQSDMDAEMDMSTQEVSYWDGPSSVLRWKTTKKAKVTGIITRTRQSSEIVLE